MKNPLIVVAGPTATGKTNASIALAEKINGEVISGDSMQIYKFMDIGSAKVSQHDMRGIKHYLIDELYPDEEYNAFIFQTKAKEYMQEILNKGKMPIICGGTGFYINTLVFDNEFKETENNSAYRNKLQHIADTKGSASLHEILRKKDSLSAAAIHPNNVKKIIRAIEFNDQTGTSITTHNTEQKKKESPYKLYFFVINMNREILYDRINMRVDKMVADGLFDEVKMLSEKGYTDDLVSMKGIGYKEVLGYFAGAYSYDFTIELIKKNTRHYAKRQLTWFNHQIDAIWLDSLNKSAEELSDEMIKYMK